MHGQNETSLLPRWMVMILHTAAVAVIVWLLTGGNDLLPETFQQADLDRRTLELSVLVKELFRPISGHPGSGRLRGAGACA